VTRVNELRCSATTSTQCIQEQTGQALSGYGRMKVLANKPIILKHKCKYTVQVQD